jgi:hypothetical protein
MLDLEQRLRAEIVREAQAFEPSLDLAERVGRRVRRRVRRNRILAAAAATVVVAAVGAGGLVATGDERGGGRTEIGDQPTGGATTTAPAPTTTPPETAPTTLPASVGEPAVPAIDADTPLSRTGIGPIRAGMTIREAEAAADLHLAIDQGAWEAFGRTCGVFTIEGMDHFFVARTPGLVPSDDVEGAVIDVVGGTIESAARTVDGIGPGSTVAEVTAAYGQPTGSDPMWGIPGDEILLFESGGYSYGFRVEQGVVAEVRSGHVVGLGDFEPCA